MSDVDDDDEFVARLSAVVDSDIEPVPLDLGDFARAAQAWSVVDEQLADIVEAEVATVRSTSAGGATIFNVSSREISVWLRGRVLVGEISPVDDDVGAEVETLEDLRSVPIDDLGRFRLTDVGLPFRVRITVSAQRVGVTPWVTH